MRAPEHPQNAARLRALAAYGILDTPAAPNFDEITAMVAAVCEAPIALISLVDRDRQWFLSTQGVSLRSTPIETSVCAHAILQDAVFEVGDLRADPRFADMSLVVEDPQIRFYAGEVLRDPTGLPMGTLCVIDHEARSVDDRQRHTLQVMARRVMREIELHRVALRSHTLAAELADAVATRGAILDVVSEALRGPLNTISLSTSLMAGGPLPPSARAGFAHGLSTAAGTMASLVNDLLDVSLMEGGRLRLQPADVCPATLIVDAAQRAHATRTHTRQTLRVEIADGLPRARWDAGRVSQLVEYLMRNAQAVSAPNGAIGLTVRPKIDDANAIVVQITDHGAHIPARRLATLFEPFAHGPQAATRGGGLRMAVVRGIAQAHGGGVEAHSDARQTRMIAWLPGDPAAIDRA